MAYVDGLLATNERILRRARQHPLVIVDHARMGIVAVVLGIAVAWLGRAANLSGGTGGSLGAAEIVNLAALVLVLAGVLRIAWCVLAWRNRDFVVTTRRIVATEGVLNRRATDSSLEKINDAVLTQSIVGRLLGFGDLEVLTASEAGIERLHLLPKPVDFKRAMLDAKFALEREFGGSSGV